MDRSQIFRNLAYHAFYGRDYNRLRKGELAACRAFLELHQDADNDAFVFALNRWMLGDAEKPRNWTIMMDLLQATATTERASNVDICPNCRQTQTACKCTDDEIIAATREIE